MRQGWNRTPEQSGQELFREDRWRDMTYSMMDGVGDDQAAYSYPTAAPATSSLSTQALDSQASVASDAEGKQPTNATSAAGLPEQLNLPEGATIIHPLGWGDPFVTMNGELEHSLQPRAPDALRPLTGFGSPEADIASAELDALSLPNSGLSSALGLSPETVQAPAPTGLANGGLPSDDLAFENSLTTQSGEPVAAGVLGIRAPGAAQLSNTPAEDSVLSSVVALSGMESPGPGSCGPNDPDNPNGPITPYGCPDPYGPGPGAGGPPGDPGDLDCLCGKSPNFNPNTTPFEEVLASGVDAFVEDIADTADLFVGGVTYIADGYNMAIQFAQGVPGYEIDQHMSANLWRETMTNLTGEASFTANWTKSRMVYMSESLNDCGELQKTSKSVVMLAMSVNPKGLVRGGTKGISRVADGLSHKPPSKRELREQFKEYADTVENVKDTTKISVAYSPQTDKTYFGYSGEPKQLPKQLTDRLPSPEQLAGKRSANWVGNCAELRACARAMDDGVTDIDSLEFYTANWGTRPNLVPAKMCDACRLTFPKNKSHSK